MAGDYSRMSFDALRDFASVLMQQGHPTLDADWNEYAALVDRRMRAETVDTIGRAVVPRETPLGFQIKVAGGKLGIGRGRMYVDGLLAENHGSIGPASPPAFDRARLNAEGAAEGVLDEPISAAAGDFVDYAAQPYLPSPPALPTTPGPHLAYLDVWRREVTPFNDPRLLDPALGGIDTATRMQTVWQVRLLANVGTGASCGSDLAAWDALVAPSAARLTTATIEYKDPDEPCLIPPGGGYRGLENQLYRVELHAGGDRGAMRFKWSRENASVGTGVEAFVTADRLRVRRIGRDGVLRFSTGDWVEVTDDRRELAGLPGDLRRVEVDEDSNEFKLSAPLSADLIPAGGADTAASRHARVIRWDQGGEVRLADGGLLVDLDAAGSDGTIPLPPAGKAVVLEAGITVAFDLDPAGGAGKAMDHWSFAARTAGAQIEALDRAPPAGIQHHYARLGIVTFPGSVADCRIFWPPAMGDDCACTVCVTAAGHNDGSFTIQQAVADLPATGGTVCLGPGVFTLGSAPVTIDKGESVRLRGHGTATVLSYVGDGAALRLIECAECEVADLGVYLPRATGTAQGAGIAAGLLVRGGNLIALRRLAMLVANPRTAGSYGIALDGTIAGLEIEHSAIFAPVCIGALADPAAQAGPRYLGLGDARITANLLFGPVGIALEGRVIHLAPARITLNGILATVAAVRVTGTGEAALADSAALATAQRGVTAGFGGVALTENSILVGVKASGVVSGVPAVQIVDNAILGLAQDDDKGGAPAADETNCAIRLVEGFLPRRRPDAQVTGNRIGRFAGFGISIEEGQGSLLIAQNLIADCAAGGIRTTADTRTTVLSIDGNVISRVADGVRGEGAVAIALSGVIEGRLTGNSIADVGARVAAAGYVAAIEVRGALALDIAHNRLSGIGRAGASIKQLYGMRLSGALVTLGITANQITDLESATENEAASWIAIAIDNRLAAADGVATTGASGEDAQPDKGGTFPAYVALDTRLLQVTQRGTTVVGTRREAQIRIDGNQIADARPRSALPLVLVRGGTGTTCTFVTNQCHRLARDRLPPVVLLAQRLIVSNNQVRHESDAPAMALTCGVGQKPTATVVGNITFGGIGLNGQSLGDPWAPLNILG